MKAIYAMMLVAGVAVSAQAVAADGKADGKAVAAGGKAVAAGGKDLYEKTCKTCHAAGVAGAPKLGDKAAWAPRIKTGKEALYTSVIKGKNAMPPKGTAMTATDAEIKKTVDYMVDQSK